MTMLEGAEPFSVHHRRYDEWFARHEAAYLLELLAVRNKVIGSIPHDPGLVRAGLSGSPVGELKAIENVDPIVQRLEQTVSLQQKTYIKACTSRVSGAVEEFGRTKKNA